MTKVPWHPPVLLKKRGAAGAAGCVEGLWSASLKGQGKRFLGLMGPFGPKGS